MKDSDEPEKKHIIIIPNEEILKASSELFDIVKVDYLSREKIDREAALISMIGLGMRMGIEMMCAQINNIIEISGGIEKEIDLCITGNRDIDKTIDDYFDLYCPCDTHEKKRAENQKPEVTH